MSEEVEFEPYFPKKARLEERDGLVVVREEMTPEMRKQRREDNRTMKQSRKVHRNAKKHGTRISVSERKEKPWLSESKAKKKQKRLEKLQQSQSS